MKILIMISIIAGGGYYFMFNNSPTSFDEAGNPTTIVFTQNECGTWCANGVKDLERRKIPFTEYPIDNNKENKARYEAAGSKGLPYFVMGNQTMVGYSPVYFANNVAQAFGDKYLTRMEKKYYRNHFYDDGSPLIYIYGASWCPYCKKLRKELSERNLDYVELDVEKSDERQLITSTLGIDGYPSVFVGYVRVKYSEDLIDNILDSVSTAANRKI